MRVSLSRRWAHASFAAACAVGCSMLAQAPAFADQPQPPTISVTSTGSVTYVPDLVQMSLGVRAQAASAADASAQVNAAAQSVVAALRRAGVQDADIRTEDYSVYQAPESQAAISPAPGEVTTQSVIRKPIPGPASYIASESLYVQMPIARAGDVIDAAVAAGANQSAGFTLDTSQRESLTRQAMVKAVQTARAQAEVIARAAGVVLAGVQTIESGPQQIFSTVRFAAAALGSGGMPPPIESGTGTINVTITVVYRIK
jgi:uncharacterized protein